MRAFRRIAVAGALALGLMVTASASAAVHGVTLSAPKTVTVNHASCTVGGLPGDCLLVVGSATNNNPQAYACQVLDENGFIAMDTTLAPGQTVEWGISGPYTGQSALTFTLYCNGALVPGQTERTRVLP